MSLLYAFGCVSAVASAIHKQLLISKHKAATVGGERGSLLRVSCNVNVWSFIQNGDVILILVAAPLLWTAGLDGLIKPIRTLEKLLLLTCSAAGNGLP